MALILAFLFSSRISDNSPKISPSEIFPTDLPPISTPTVPDKSK